MAVEVVVPEDHLGAVIGDLRQRRAQIRDLGDRSNAKLVEASVPLRMMFGYSTDLRSATEGKAEFTMEFARYAPAPGDVDYIVERMQHCPVSKNLRPVADNHTSLTLD